MYFRTNPLRMMRMGQRICRGIPGWEKVDQLVRALLELEGLCVTNTQANTIKTLHSQLLEFDKRPITFRPRQVKQPKGEVCSL